MGTVTKDLAFVSQESWEEGRKTVMLWGIQIKNGWTFPRFVKTHTYSVSISWAYHSKIDPQRISVGQDIFIGEFYEAFKKLIPVLDNPFQKIEEDGALPSSLSEASVADANAKDS